MLKLSLPNKRRFTALEIEGRLVKLAQAQDLAGSRKIIKFLAKDLSSHTPENIVQSLKNVVDELNGPIGHLTLCIPRHKVTVRFLKFPTTNEKEIAGMVNLQSAKELPLSKEEIVTDYLISERTKEGYAKVALVIVHQDVISGYLDILNKAGLEPQRLTFSTEAIVDWHRIAFGREKVAACSLLIDLDTDNTDIVLLHNFDLGFTRGLTLGMAQVKNEPDFKQRLAEEIRRTIEGYTRQEKAIKIDKIILAQTNKAITEDIKSFLIQEFNLPCEIVMPLKNLPCQKDISFGQNELGFSPLRVLGAVFATPEKRLNLLPEVLRKKQEYKLNKKRLVTTVALSLMIILLSLSLVAKKIHDNKLRIAYLDKEIEKTEKQAEEVENMLKQIELIESRRNISGSSVDVLRELHSLVSQDISLSVFTYDEDTSTVSIQGVSGNMSQILNFINTLEKSAIFKNVQLKYVNEKNAKGSEATNFKIECSLEK